MNSRATLKGYALPGLTKHFGHSLITIYYITLLCGETMLLCYKKSVPELNLERCKNAQSEMQHVRISLFWKEIKKRYAGSNAWKIHTWSKHTVDTYCKRSAWLHVQYCFRWLSSYTVPFQVNNLRPMTLKKKKNWSIAALQ